MQETVPGKAEAKLKRNGKIVLKRTEQYSQINGGEWSAAFVVR